MDQELDNKAMLNIVIDELPLSIQLIAQLRRIDDKTSQEGFLSRYGR